MTKREVVAAYHEARTRARAMSLIRLRWHERRFGRHTANPDQIDLARRAAFRDELRDRGHQWLQ